MKSSELNSNPSSLKFEHKSLSKTDLVKLISSNQNAIKTSNVAINQPHLALKINQSKQALQKLSPTELNFINSNLFSIPDPKSNNLALQILNVINKSSNKLLTPALKNQAGSLDQVAKDKIEKFINLLETNNSDKQKFKDSNNTNWRLAISPWADLSKKQNITLLKLLIRDEDSNKKNKPQNLDQAGSRFIFELEFSDIGSIIIDCLYFETKKTILVIIKTTKLLSIDEKKELTSKFLGPLASIGWYGKINFVVEKNMQSILFELLI